MKIEMSEKIFNKILEKTQEIKELATLARMGPNRERQMRFNQILCCANELSRLQGEAQIILQESVI